MNARSQQSEQVNSFVCIQVQNERSYETHFTTGVFKDDFRVVGETSQAVGRPHHRYVVHVHLRESHNFRSSKALHNTLIER